MTIGERIKQRRKELGLTQTELAKRMGLTSKTTICKAETSDFNPTMDRVREFAKALETTPSYLMGWRELPDDVQKAATAAVEATLDTDLQDLIVDYMKLSSPDKKTVRELASFLAQKTTTDQTEQ